MGELMDLAFTSSQKIVDGQLKSNYAPVSVPYYTVADEEDDAPKADTVAGKKSRPKMVHVDEMNANAAKQLFLSEDGYLHEDQIFLIQLPAVLPELMDPGEEVARDNEDAASAGAGAGITRLPDGLLGKLRIHKSGRVRMEIGGLPFCVDQGCDTFFRQDLACVCPLASEIHNLGHI